MTKADYNYRKLTNSILTHCDVDQQYLEDGVESKDEEDVTWWFLERTEGKQHNDIEGGDE